MRAKVLVCAVPAAGAKTVQRVRACAEGGAWCAMRAVKWQPARGRCAVVVLQPRGACPSGVRADARMKQCQLAHVCWSTPTCV